MPSKFIDRVTLINITIFVEAFLLLAATFWSQLAGIQLAPRLHLAVPTILWGSGGGIALASISLILFWLGNKVSLFRGMHDMVVQQIAPIFSDLNFKDIIIIALTSGFCEEVFFRGVLQAQLGLLATSFIFGLLHCPIGPGSNPDFKQLSYGVWALAAGLLLGLLYQYTNNLWAPILAHMVSNAISLVFIRYAIKSPPPAPTT